MSDFSMESTFRSGVPARDKLLSRVFGIFNEQVVRHWAAADASPFDDLGRPTLRYPDEMRGHTLDFTLRSRDTGKILVTEMKCELEFEGYRYLRLQDADQVRHHVGGAAFQKLIALSADNDAVPVFLGGSRVVVDGTALVWGATTRAGVSTTRATYGFTEVFSVEDMISDLQAWRPPTWIAFMEDRRVWLNDLVDRILGDE